MPILYTAVGYACSDVSHSVISFVYTAIGYACIDFILVYTAIGYTNNDINLGCTTIRKIVLSALIGHRIVVYASSVCTKLLGTLA